MSNYLGERTPERLGDQGTEDAGDDGEVDDVGALGEVVDEGFGEMSAGGKEDDGHVVEAKESDHDRQDDEDADHLASTEVGTETMDIYKVGKIDRLDPPQVCVPCNQAAFIWKVELPPDVEIVH